MAVILQHLNGEYSFALREKIAYCNSLHTNAKDAVMDVYTQALHDGFTANQAKKICLKEIRFFGKSSIYSALPQASKATNGVGRPKKEFPKLEIRDNNGFEIKRLRKLHEAQIAHMQTELDQKDSLIRQLRAYGSNAQPQSEVIVKKAFALMAAKALAECEDHVVIRLEGNKAVSVFADVRLKA